MRSSAKKTFLLPVIVTGLLILSTCRTNHDLQKIVSTDPYFKERKQKPDTTNYEHITALSSHLNSNDSLFGDYHFIVWAGYHGHSLTLNKDSTFEEYMWTDVVEKPDYVKGKWSLRRGLLILKQDNRKEFSFVFYRYSWAVFLIPTSKIKPFTVNLEKNKSRIDSLSASVVTIRGSTLDRLLNGFRYLCFYRHPEKEEN